MGTEGTEDTDSENTQEWGRNPDVKTEEKRQGHERNWRLKQRNTNTQEW